MGKEKVMSMYKWRSARPREQKTEEGKAAPLLVSQPYLPLAK